MAERRPGNPTDSTTWTVLRHASGGLKIWDCLPFGPWSLAAGPFLGSDGHARACDAFAELEEREARR